MSSVANSCVVEGCEGDKYSPIRGMCRRHYARWLKFGSVEYKLTRFPKVCSVGGCDRKVHGRGLCRTHYNQWYDKNEINGSCSIEGCDRAKKIQDLCRLHYRRWHRTGQI